MNEEIIARFGADLGPLNAGMRSAKATMTSWVKEVGTLIGGGVLLQGMQSVINKFDDLKDRADNLEISTDFLQGMQQIASRDAVGGVEAFNKGITDLSVNLGKLRDGDEAAAKSFKKLGISVEDVLGMNAEEVFYLIADRIKATEDPTARLSLAFDVLGKGGKSMAGMLGQGSEELRKMVDAVDKLDIDKINQLAAAKDRMEDLQNTATIWAGKLIGGVADLGTMFGEVFSGANIRGDQTAFVTREVDKYNKEIQAAKDQVANAKIIAQKKEQIQLDQNKATLEKLAANRQKELNDIREIETKQLKEQNAILKARENYFTARSDRTRWTVGELADQAMTKWNSGQSISTRERDAVWIQQLEQQSKQARAAGYDDYALQLDQQARAIRAQDMALTSGERDPLKTQEDQLKALLDLQDSLTNGEAVVQVKGA